MTHPLQRAAYDNSIAKGFWPCPELDGEDAPELLASKVALIHSEVSELLEAYREDPTAQCGKWRDGSLKGREPIPLSREEEEMGDILLRLFDLAERRGIDLMEVALRKHEFNLTRPVKHGKAF
jgi:NTP pyrophosphatase (non-canonical NTP hydrolase)